MPFSQLKPVDNKEAKVYLPFCPESRRRFLAHAIGLYKLKSLEGTRIIEGGKNISFVASWNMSSLPIDSTHCQVLFEDNADLCYNVTIQSSDFVNHLIQVLLTASRTRNVDFSKTFYRKLMGIYD